MMNDIKVTILMHFAVATCPKLFNIGNSESVECVNEYFENDAACSGSSCRWNTRCQVTCQDGYAVPGHFSSMVVCGDDGKWDDSEPRCAGKLPANLS